MSLIGIAGRLAFCAVLGPQAMCIELLAQGPGVSEETLLHADPSEWLSYGRDYAETHYSPLDQIDSDNVDKLELAWSWPVPDTVAVLEATPLVSNGVLYATGTWNRVFALDVRTGQLEWEWDPGIVRGGRTLGGPSICCAGPVNRGVALYQDKVIVGLLDGRLVALNRDTGLPVWAVQTTPVGSDHSITGAPRVVKGKVIIGSSGGEYGVRGYVSAYDAETGRLVWRFYTVPGNPNEPFENEAMARAAATWTGDWWKWGGGGTAWDSFAFDPKADLLYVGTGNGSPWSADIRSPAGGDNLYLSSILALRPDTGELVWYYQTTPGDNWDYTATQNMVLADLMIDGRLRRVLMQAPKNGFFYVLDRLTGELISAEAYVDVTWADGVDLKTGRPNVVPEALYGSSEGVWLSPGPDGAHNWHPMSWSPKTGLVYIPGMNSNFYFSQVDDLKPEPGKYTTGVPLTRGYRGPPGETVPELSGPMGFLLAWDPIQQEEVWRLPLETTYNGGTLVTGGNVVFSGSAQGRLLAHASDTGEELWEARLVYPTSSLPGVATPITYEIDGVQYVTVLAGRGGDDGAGVWTFRLADGARDPVSAFPQPQTVDALFREAWALQSDGQREAAIEVYEELLVLDPDHRQGAFNLGIAYLEGERRAGWSRSAELFETVLRIDPTYVEAIYDLASSYWKLGEIETAASFDRRYLELDEHLTHASLREVARNRLREAGLDP